MVGPVAASEEETAELGRRPGGRGLSLRPLKNGMFEKETYFVGYSDEQ